MQVFLDLAVLVDAQGDMLDNIESQVKQNLNIHFAFQGFLMTRYLKSSCQIIKYSRSGIQKGLMYEIHNNNV